MNQASRNILEKSLEDLDKQMNEERARRDAHVEELAQADRNLTAMQRARDQLAEDLGYG